MRSVPVLPVSLLLLPHESRQKKEHFYTMQEVERLREYLNIVPLFVIHTYTYHNLVKFIRKATFILVNCFVRL